MPLNWLHSFWLFKNFIRACVFMHVREGSGEHAMACMSRSEDSVWKSVLTFHVEMGSASMHHELSRLHRPPHRGNAGIIDVRYHM